MKIEEIIDTSSTKKIEEITLLPSFCYEENKYIRYSGRYVNISFMQRSHHKHPYGSAGKKGVAEEVTASLLNFGKYFFLLDI